jgi:hypothetical protein
MYPLFGGVAVLVWVASATQPFCDTTVAWQDGVMTALTNRLQSNNFSLYQQGVMRFTAGDAFGNNPSSKYGVYDFFLDELPVYWLGEGDAIVLLFCTPPLLKYFAARSYVFNENGTDGSIITLFASLGDSNNILTFNTTDGGPCNRACSFGVRIAHRVQLRWLISNIIALLCRRQQSSQPQILLQLP